MEKTEEYGFNVLRWKQIRNLVNDAMRKRDRSVSIYFNPDDGIFVSVYQWVKTLNN